MSETYTKTNLSVNLGLRHSGEKGKSKYDDKSGMLGHSYLVDERPRQCFNSAKVSLMILLLDEEGM